VLYLDTDFDGCMKLVQEITKGRNALSGHSMNSLARGGPADGRHRNRPSISTGRRRDVIIIPGGNLGNVFALGKGLMMMKDLGLNFQAAPHRRGPRRNTPIRFTARSKMDLNRLSRCARKKKPLASAIQIGNPVSIQKAVRTLKQFNGIVEQASEEGDSRDAAALGEQDRNVQLPAHRRGARRAHQVVEGRKN